MAKRSVRIAEMREKGEISCMWGLFSILESCQGHSSHKMISNGRPIRKHIIDNPGKLIQPASFDEECQKLKNVAFLGQKSTQTDSKLIDHPSKTHKKATKNSQKVSQLSSHHSNNESSLINQPASSSSSTSSDVSLNKLKFAAILEALCAQNHREEITLSEGLKRSISAKALLDQMFLERTFLNEGTGSGSKSFSHALDVLNSNRDLWQTVDYKCKNPFKTSYTDKKSSDRIVILKPAPRNSIYSENITCHCSSDAKLAPFSFKEMKKKLKHTFQGTRKGGKLIQNRSILDVRESCTCHGVDIGDFCAVCKKRGQFESSLERKKLDFSSGRFTKKHEFDVIMEAKRHLSTRLKNMNSVENPTSKRSPKTLGRILSSPELDDCSDSGKIRLSPYCSSPLRPNKEDILFDDYDKYDCTLEILHKKNSSSSLISYDEEGIETILSDSDNMKCNGELSIEEMDSTETIGSQKEHEIDLLSANERCISPVHDSPSRTYQLDSNKHQEEYRSPVSVLEPFFVEDSNSPSSITPRTKQFSSGQPLQPLRLDFEEHSFESLTPRPSTHTNTSIEDQDYISHYVHLVLQASCLNWDNLSETKPWTLPEELLDPSLFDDLIDFLPTDCYFDPKLLFDHMNEVLQEIYRSHFSYPPWLTSFIQPRIMSVPLEELVLDQIMNEAEFYLLPWTEKRTLDQLVSKDVANCGSWIDVRNDTERIVIDVSEDLLDGCILDVILELHI